jgi:pre-mRNA cleavage complex 2 protein Pcf11
VFLTLQKDGTLIVPGSLRKEMQSILDEIYNGMQNELEKVSLERLADIDPGLLIKIKGAAEESMRSSRGQVDNAQQAKIANATYDSQLPSFFTETRSPECIKISNEWQQLKTWKPIEQTQELITKLHTIVDDGGSTEHVKLYTREEALQMAQYFAVVSIAETYLKSGLASLSNQSTPLNKASAMGSQRFKPVSVTGGSFAVDKNDFTNEGIKKKNEAVVGLLYDIGLPYVSSADGRRFNSHIELSHHLDALFKRSQLEKSMARTEERGWYRFDHNWIQRISDEETKAVGTSADGTSDIDVDNTDNTEISTVAADESRDRCAICGLKFKMHFDHDDGIYKYSNCKEVEVMNDDAAETESDMKLVHFTCWKGLGSPDILTFDQTLQDDL